MSLINLNSTDNKFRKRATVIDTAKLKTSVTVPLTREHEELLLKASTGGDHFRATGGGHVATGRYVCIN